MLSKLHVEVSAFKGEESATQAVNALWTGYHLLEWVWNERLQGDADLRRHVGVNSEADLRSKVQLEHPRFKVVNALANGAKHFNQRPTDPATGAHQGSFSNAFSKAFDVDHLFIEVDGSPVDVEVVLDELLAYWDGFFANNLR